MGNCLVKFSVLVLLLAFSALGEAPIPSGWEEYLELDRKHNIPSRTATPEVKKQSIMTNKQAALVPVYHFDVLATQANQAETKLGLDPKIQQQVKIKKDGKSYVRFFVVEQSSSFEELKKRYKLESEYTGTKLQSHSTFLIWHNQKKSLQPLFVKIQTGEGDDEANGYDQANSSVKNNDPIKKILKASKPKNWDVFEEPFAANVKDQDFSYANSIRSTAAKSPNTATSKLYPVHGVFGSKKHLEAFAKANKSSVPEWEQEEYLPALAKFLADAHFTKGIYLAAHTQNLNMRVNPKTGKVQKFMVKDLFDVMIDDFTVKKNNLLGDTVDVGSANLNGEHFFDPDAPRGSEPGFHFGMYAGQSVIDIAASEEEQRANVKAFLKAYKAEAEKILGKKLEYSKEGQRAVDALDIDDRTYSTGDKDYDEYDEVRRMLMRAVQDIYEGFMKKQMPELTPQMFSYHQNLVKNMVADCHDSGKLNFLVQKKSKLLTNELESATHNAKFRYAFDGTRLYVYDKGTKQIVATSDPVSIDQRAWLKHSRVHYCPTEKLAP